MVIAIVAAEAVATAAAVHRVDKYILKYFLQPTDIFHYEHSKVCYDYLLLYLGSNTGSKPWPTYHIQSFRLHLLEKNIVSYSNTQNYLQFIKNIYSSSVRNIFWQRTRTITVGWFAGCMCKNNYTWYTYLPKLRGSFQKKCTEGNVYRIGIPDMW